MSILKHKFDIQIQQAVAMRFYSGTLIKVVTTASISVTGSRACVGTAAG